VLNLLTCRIGVLAVLASSSFAALAHDTWLAPDLYHRVSPGAVTLSLTSGMNFPDLDHAIKPDRVAVAKARDASGRTADMKTMTEREHALAFRRDVAGGVTTFWVVLDPRSSQLEPGQVREYVEHLGLLDTEAVMTAWEKKGKANVQYRYIKYSKTFVRAGQAKTDDGWSEPAGMRLELIPEEDPTRLRAGQTLRFLLLDEGTPRAEYPVSVIAAGGTRAYRTDDRGRVTIDVAAAGPYLVRATTLTPSAVPNAEWDVHFTTLSFEAHADRR
jgi:uncharacterized GH25 family protein